MIELYNFEAVTEFIYLGTLINCKNNLEEEIKHTIIIGNRCYYGMSKLITSQLLKRKSKYQLYKTTILPAVLYGCESWTLSKAHEALLGGFQRKILRRTYRAVQIDGVWQRCYSQELYSLFNGVDIIKRIKINRLRWAGHVIRRENEEIIKRLMIVKPEGKRKKGRPRMRWMDGVDGLRNLGVVNWRAKAQERDSWRKFLEQAKTHEGLECQ
jgi:hypothetical protein